MKYEVCSFWAFRQDYPARAPLTCVMGWVDKPRLFYYFYHFSFYLEKEEKKTVAQVLSNILINLLALPSALHCAASRGHTDCLETLVALCGANVDVIDSNGCTALFYAATLGHADSTQLLLSLGAEPNRQDRKGRTWVLPGKAKKCKIRSCAHFYLFFSSLIIFFFLPKRPLFNPNFSIYFFRLVAKVSP